MPEGIERYGIIYGLDETTLTRIWSGFDEIRAVSGWENFRIPSYVWDYIDQIERDWLLAWLQTALWTTRDGVDLPSSVSKSMHLVFCYTLFVWAEWWRDCPDADKPTPAEMYSKIESDCGVPSSALGTLSTYETIDVEVYWSIAHPSGETGLDVEMIDFANYPPTLYDDIYCWVEIGTISDFTFYFSSDTDERYFCYLGDVFTGAKDYNSNWDDLGIVAEWPDDVYVFQPWIKANYEYEVLTGSARFRDFGLMEGYVELVTSLGVGTELFVSDVVNGVVYFTGIVTEVKQNLAEGTYEHRIADPVTAGGGTVEYTSGNAIDALQQAIENHGGTFETPMTTSETVFYPADEPQDAYQFFRAVSYAVGGVLQYGRDGVYRLVATPAAHGVDDSLVIADDGPTIEERTKDYANYIQATIDERWMVEAITSTTESYSIGSQSYSATRLGEQILSETISLGGDSLEITYDYDENGYMTRKEHSEEGSGLGAVKKTSEITWSNISADGNQYNVDELHEEFTYCQLYDNDTGTFYNSWVPTSKTTREWRVNLDGMAYMEEEIWGTEPLFAGSIFIPTDLYPALGSLIRLHKYRGGAVISPVAGPLEGRGIFKKYNYVHNGFEDNGGIPTGTVGYVYVGTETRSVSPPPLEMCKAEEENEVHIIAVAEDQASITVLGRHKYETQAVALNTSTGMRNFAKGVLYEKSRIRLANISSAMGFILPLDTVGWRDLVWTVKSVTVSLDGSNDDIEMATQSTRNHLAGALSKEPVTWTEDVQNAINRRVGQFDNVSRGKVMTRVGKRRYTVQVEGKADPVEARALNDDPVPVNASVLLVRPTGKNQPWTLLNLSKEDEITITANVEENITPEQDPTVGITFFTADITDPMPGETVTLTWDYIIPDGYSYTRLIVSDGAGNTTTITNEATKTLEITYSEEDGTQFTPTVALVYEYGDSPIEYHCEPYDLDNGPIILMYLDIQLEVSPSSGDSLPHIAGVKITVTPHIETWSDYTASICHIRKSATEPYEDISLVTQYKQYIYEDEGTYEVKLEVTYQNSRFFQKEITLTSIVTVDEDIVVPELFYPVGSGVFYNDIHEAGSSDRHVQLWSGRIDECGPISPYTIRRLDANFDLTLKLDWTASIDFGELATHYLTFNTGTGKCYGAELEFNIGSVSIQTNIITRLGIEIPQYSPMPGYYCVWIVGLYGYFHIEWQNKYTEYYAKSNALYAGGGFTMLTYAERTEDLATVTLSGSLRADVSLDDTTLSFNYNGSGVSFSQYTSGASVSSPYTNALGSSKIGSDEVGNSYADGGLLLNTTTGGSMGMWSGLVEVSKYTSARTKAIAAVRNIRPRTW